VEAPVEKPKESTGSLIKALESNIAKPESFVASQPILPGPSPQAAPVAMNPVHAQTKSDTDAELEAMLDVERK
jgi:hypothetical protein